MTFVLTEPNGRQTTLLSVPRCNPHWQLTYVLAKPLRIRRGSNNGTPSPGWRPTARSTRRM